MSEKKYDTIPVPMSPVESSQIHAVGHDPQSNRMYVQFLSGKGEERGPGSVYHYDNVTAEKYQDFAAAESKGSHFLHNFKKNEKDHPFTKLNLEPKSDK